LQVGVRSGGRKQYEAIQTAVKGSEEVNGETANHMGRENPTELGGCLKRETGDCYVWVKLSCHKEVKLAIAGTNYLGPKNKPVIYKRTEASAAF